MEKDKCKNKIPYTTKNQALAARAVYNWQYGKIKLKAYKCKNCKMWHLATDYDD